MDTVLSTCIKTSYHLHSPRKDPQASISLMVHLIILPSPICLTTSPELPPTYTDLLIFPTRCHLGEFMFVHPISVAQPSRVSLASQDGWSATLYCLNHSLRRPRYCLRGEGPSPADTVSGWKGSGLCQIKCSRQRPRICEIPGSQG